MSPMKVDQNGDSRDRILYLLKTRGPQTASELARRMSMTSMGVRQHLTRLGEQGLVAHEDHRGSVGRPRRVFQLTEAAEERFPEGYADLTVGLIDSVRQAFGAEGMDRLVEVRHEEQLARYRARMPDDASLARRVAALTRLRTEEGYLAEWSKSRDGSLRLVENHCPICVAARACTRLCASEQRLFQELIGDDADVDREEHILDGARRCVYRITPR